MTANSSSVGEILARVAEMSDEEAIQYLKNESINILNSITDPATKAPNDDALEDVSAELAESSAEQAELIRVLANIQPAIPIMRERSAAHPPIKMKNAFDIMLESSKVCWPAS